MSRYYQRLDEPFIDYGIIDIEGIPRPIRGPGVDFDQPYAACIGAAQTFGRFCERPYPSQLQEALELPVLNLAIGGTGPAFYRKPGLMRVLQGARLVIAQVLSGRSASNSAFRTDGDIQGTITATGERGRLEPLLAELLRTKPRDFVEKIVQETRADFVAQFRALLTEIGRPTVLFWFATRSPDYTLEFGSVHDLVGPYPQFVDRSTIDAIRPEASEYVESVSRRGFPQRLWRAPTAVEGTRRDTDGFLYNHYYPTPEMHDDATQALMAPCRALLRDFSHGKS